MPSNPRFYYSTISGEIQGGIFMTEDKFVLVRKQRDYKQTDKFPKIRVPLETYEKMTEWAAESGLSISELARRAVEYADRHLAYVVE